MNKKPDILEVVQAQGIELRQRGQKFWACCPLHNEKTPSFVVDAEKQVFFCFGCQKGGDVIRFVQELRGCDFKAALKYLGIKNGKPPPPDPTADRKRDLVASFREWERLYRNKLFDEVLVMNRLKLSNMTEVEELASLFHHATDVERELYILTEGDDEDKYKLYCEVNGIDF